MKSFQLTSTSVLTCAVITLLAATKAEECGGCERSVDVARACLNDTGPEVVRIEKTTQSYKCRNLPPFLSWLHRLIHLPVYKTCSRTTYHYVREKTFTPFCCEGYVLTNEDTCKQCGRSKYSERSSSADEERALAKMIVGGKPTRPNQYPWIVRLRSAFDSYFFNCAGAIVGPRWILTAAHCLHGSNNDESYLVVGDHDRRWYKFGKREKKYKYAKIYCHPKYQGGSVSDYDIALVKTEEIIKYNEDVQPACLPSEARTYAGETVTVAGWGLTNATTAASPIYLQHARARVKEPHHCDEGNFKNLICAQGDRGTNICVGDSGGPMMYTEDGYTTVIGVSWWSVRGCTPGKNFGYTAVGPYLEWIRKTLQQNNDL